MKNLLKKNLVLIPAIALAMTGCTTTTDSTSTTTTNTLGSTATSIGKTVFQAAVAQKCRSELSNNSIWNAAKKVLSEDTQTEVETNVCACVGENASETVTVGQLTAAAIDTTARTELVSEVVSSSYQACYSEVLTSLQ